MLVDEYVDVVVNSHTINRYKELGYVNVVLYNTISVKVDDAPFNSRARIKVKCDYCGEIFETSVFCYKNSIKTINKNCCNKKECKNQKTKEINLYKYGVDNVAKISEVRKKMAETSLERYGCENPIMSPEIKEKRDKTMIERYGVLYPAQNKEILDRIHHTNFERYGVATPMESEELKKNYQDSIREKYGVEWISQNTQVRQKQIETCREKYGVDNPLQSPEIREKMTNTCIERYGVDNVLKLPETQQQRLNTMIEKYGVPYALQNSEIMERCQRTCIEKYGYPCSLQNQEVKEKGAQTLYKNGNIPTSKQQLYLFNLYNKNGNFELNYPISYYHADMCSVDEKLVIEYDGSGHKISVVYGNLTEEEFDRKEIIRSHVIKREGFKQIRLISRHDKLPSDETLLQLLDISKQYFIDNPERSWIEFDFDSSIMRNTLHKEGVFFDYGELRALPFQEVA